MLPKWMEILYKVVELFITTKRMRLKALEQQEFINENSWQTSWVPSFDKFSKLMGRKENVIYLGISKTSDTMSDDILLANLF